MKVVMVSNHKVCTDSEANNFVRFLCDDGYTTGEEAKGQGIKARDEEN